MKQFTFSSRILHDYFSRRKRFGAVFFLVYLVCLMNWKHMVSLGREGKATVEFWLGVVWSGFCMDVDDTQGQYSLLYRDGPSDETVFNAHNNLYSSPSSPASSSVACTAKARFVLVSSQSKVFTVQSSLLFSHFLVPCRSRSQ
jgi:hypothetical protein